MDPRSRVLSSMLYLVLPLMLVFRRSKRLHLGVTSCVDLRRGNHVACSTIPVCFSWFFFLPVALAWIPFVGFFFNLKLNVDFLVTLLDSSHVLIKLLSDMDYSRVFCHRSNLVYNCYMKLSKLSPTLDIGVESSVIPIWIFFPNLRPHLFSPRILHALGSLFGRPLKVDNATSIGSRPSLARVLVELDITKKYPEKVWLGPDKLGYIQSVEMEPFPPFCDQCKALGHGRGECRSMSSVPVKGLANSNIPIKNVGNGIVVENVVVDGNVDVASSNPLCPVTSLIGAGNGVVSALGVEAAEAGVHSSAVDLVGPSLVASVAGPLVYPVAPEAVALVSEIIDVCKVNPEPEVVDVGPSKLGVIAAISPVNDLDSTVGAFPPTHLVDVPVSLISNVAMHAHLASKLKECPVDHPDWLEVSSLGGDVEGKSSAEPTDNLHEFYSLKALVLLSCLDEVFGCLYFGSLAFRLWGCRRVLLVWIVVVRFLPRAMMRRLCSPSDLVGLLAIIAGGSLVFFVSVLA
ncbi:hypothetical protein M5K25_014011 [Dendrobium thyrsiflorum]|uniref:DUF4283 domain-containing protein n=1 Tax=Dendrobium thyrsiflorum TaxID=117978 RepID=A0ABD0V1B1_DENTH